MANKVGKTGKQNRNAGNHPSYKKRGMSKEQIEKKRKRDTAYGKRKANKKSRALHGKKRKELGLKVGDSRDASKKVSVKDGKVKWTKESRSKNRGSKSSAPGDKRARGGKKQK